MKNDISTDSRTNTENKDSGVHKITWEKPELEVCQLNQTLGSFGSGGDGGNARTT